MDKKLFADLVESMEQMNEIVRGKPQSLTRIWLVAEESEERWFKPAAQDSNPEG